MENEKHCYIVLTLDREERKMSLEAADVGADLVGKVEAGIPEDDPRNPACIADNVGDNVGDVAGMGSDLYESYVASILSAIALSVAAGTGLNGLVAPMVLAAAGILASLIGTFFVSTKEGASQKNLLASLRKGVYIASVLFAVLAFLVVYFMLGITNIGYFIAILCGLVAGNIIGIITEYYTSDASKPTKDLAESSETGSATVIISGLALGMRSTLYPVIVVCIAVLISYFCSIHLTDPHPELGTSANLSQGLYGIALAAVGMLSTLGITLATDAYGPVADNAGGIAEMCHLDPHVRERTDALDSLGNTTAATGKGFAIGSAALTSLALIATFVNEVGVEAVKSQIENFSLVLDITSPAVLVGLFVGAVVPFLFAAMTMSSVGRSAQSIVVEVRWAAENLPALELTALAVLARRGIFSTVTVQLVEMYFDTTRYSTGILPAGRYQALRIDLGGNARHGKNWWCVLYPGLCRSACGTYALPEENDLDR